jgi:Ser/Thr protein kinase RdoA (MazF antagonist)
MPHRDFTQLLARYPRHAQPITELVARGNAGGHSGAMLWRYRGLAGELVLRSWPAHGLSRAQLENIHEWLFLTTATGLTPVPLRDSSGRSLQEFEGTFWEITPWLRGTADAAIPPSPERLEGAISGLAAVHTRLQSKSCVGLSPGLRLRSQEVMNLMSGGFDTIEAAIGQKLGSRSALASPARQWLALARAVAPALELALRPWSTKTFRVQPCLRDARPEHFLFDENRLAGIVDFGAMGVDCVAGDLARLLGDWLDGDRALRASALAAYERTRRLAPEEISVISIFLALADLLIGQRWLSWHLLDGRRFEDPEAVSKGLARGLKRLERLALEIKRGVF